MCASLIFVVIFVILAYLRAKKSVSSFSTLRIW